MGFLSLKPEGVAPTLLAGGILPSEVSPKMTSKSLPLPKDMMKRNGLRYVTFIGPVKHFLYCKLRDVVQFPGSVTQTPLWVIPEERRLPTDLSAGDKAVWSPGMDCTTSQSSRQPILAIIL